MIKKLTTISTIILMGTQLSADGFNDNYLQVGYTSSNFKFVDEIMDIKGSVELGNGFSIIGRYGRETGEWSDPGEYETSTYSGYRIGIGKAYRLNGNTEITSSISYLDYTFKQTIKPNWRSTTTSRPTTKADSYIGSVGVRNMSPNNFETNLQINAFRGGKMKSKSNEVELSVIKHFNDKLGFGLRVLHHDAAPAVSYKSDFTEYGLFIRTSF
ncbi:hypothetical protein N9P26_02180 [Amylibacter sp.]|jgi:hypothetical protein|nr:hypothetical protein [Amylibacter sp.]